MLRIAGIKVTVMLLVFFLITEVLALINDNTADALCFCLYCKLMVSMSFLLVRVNIIAIPTSAYSCNEVSGRVSFGIGVSNLIGIIFVCVVVSVVLIVLELKQRLLFVLQIH